MGLGSSRLGNPAVGSLPAQEAIPQLPGQDSTCWDWAYWGGGGGEVGKLGQRKCGGSISLSLCTKHNKNIFRRKCSFYQML